MDSVFGIDLSGISRSAVGRTVVAEVVLEARPRLVALYPIGRGLSGDREIVDLVAERRPLVVAIDAPLSLPHGVTCRDPRCGRCEPGLGSYLTRDVDTLAGGMSTSQLAPIAFRGIFIARVLGERAPGLAVIETYPRAVLRALGLHDGSGRDPSGAAAALARLVDGVSTTQPDELDAIAAALAAAQYAARAVVGLDGTIWRIATQT